MASLTLVTAPTVEPLTTDEAKAQLRVTDSAEDDLIDALIVTARDMVEAETGRALIDQTWEWKLDGWPGCWPFELPKAPLDSVTSIKYLDTDGTEQTWASTNYRVSAYAGTHALPGRVGIEYGKTLPSLRGVTDQVTIRFVAGYGAASSAVPAPLRAAMRLLLAELYQRREAAISGTIIAEIPIGVARLLSPFRVVRWYA